MTILKKYTELNPRAELRDWHLSNGIFHGRVEFDLEHKWEVGTYIHFIATDVADYRDHLMVYKEQDIIKLNKIYQREIE
jgi:hypothetical protein